MTDLNKTLILSSKEDMPSSEYVLKGVNEWVVGGQFQSPFTLDCLRAFPCRAYL